ncbi:SPOR domain-containing protein [Thermoproteota archaeon]
MSQKPEQLNMFKQDFKVKKLKEEPKDFPIAPSRPAAKFPTQICVKTSCVLIVLILIFTLGIERGKTISKKKIDTDYDTSSLAKVEKPPIEKEIKLTKAVIPKPAAPKKKLEKKKKTAKLNDSRYIIHIVTYKKDSSYIKKELDTLKKRGYKPFIKKSGKYVVICTGEFKNKKEAQTQLTKLKTTYKDCFIKKI